MFCENKIQYKKLKHRKYIHRQIEKHRFSIAGDRRNYLFRYCNHRKKLFPSLFTRFSYKTLFRKRRNTFKKHFVTCILRDGYKFLENIANKIFKK